MLTSLSVAFARAWLANTRFPVSKSLCAISQFPLGSSNDEMLIASDETDDESDEGSADSTGVSTGVSDVSTGVSDVSTGVSDVSTGVSGDSTGVSLVALGSLAGAASLRNSRSSAGRKVEILAPLLYFYASNPPFASTCAINTPTINCFFENAGDSPITSFVLQNSLSPFCFYICRATAGFLHTFWMASRPVLAGTSVSPALMLLQIDSNSSIFFSFSSQTLRIGAAGSMALRGCGKRLGNGMPCWNFWRMNMLTAKNGNEIDAIPGHTKSILRFRLLFRVSYTCCTVSSLTPAFRNVSRSVDTLISFASPAYRGNTSVSSFRRVSSGIFQLGFAGSALCGDFSLGAFLDFDGFGDLAVMDLAAWPLRAKALAMRVGLGLLNPSESLEEEEEEEDKEEDSL